jgi:putative hemolysin
VADCGEDAIMPKPLIDFKELGRKRPAQAFLTAGQFLLEPFLKTRAFNRAYEAYETSLEKAAAENIFDFVLQQLGLSYRAELRDLERIPQSGPVFVVANHPYGGLDGLVLGSLLLRIRPDTKFLANRLLGRIAGMEEHCIFVDPFGGRAAARSNVAAMKAAMKWLSEGHLLATFPAGEVSHLTLRRMRVADPAWASNLAPLVRKSRASVVPVFFAGRNPAFFQLAGLIHPRLRTLLLPRELLKPRRGSLEVRVGRSISAKHLDRFESNRGLMDYLRLRTYLLKSRSVAEKTRFRWRRRKSSGGEPIIEAFDSRILAQEVQALTFGEHLLHESGAYAVYVARAEEIPNLLLEIGRLREMTFRAVGEGTGTACDLDRFDADYRHLFVWNREEQELVGAYRLGLTDEILPRSGRSGLYTTTLFRFKKGVLERLDPAIELGRSFVVANYQRKPLSLGLLWKGIGTFVARNPRYCRLLGPVSISKDYQSLSKKMMVTYLRTHNLDPELASQVRPLHPMRSRFWGLVDRSSFCRSVRDVEEVSALVSEIEAESVGVPVLWRQYLKLNATVLSFNVDPAFNDSLDGLVLVDLRRTEPHVLRKYMGEVGAAQFLAYHEATSQMLEPA